MKLSTSLSNSNSFHLISKSNSIDVPSTITDQDSDEGNFSRIRNTSCKSKSLLINKRKRYDNDSTKQLKIFFYLIFDWIDACIKVHKMDESLRIKLAREETKYKKIEEGKKILNYSIEKFFKKIGKSKRGKANKNIEFKTQTNINILHYSLKQLSLSNVLKAFIEEKEKFNDGEILVKYISIKEYLDAFNEIKSKISDEQKVLFKKHIQNRYIDGNIKGRKSKSEK